MAKQKSRPEKRYVPQQESYRNLPGLRPTADTIVAAETPAPDGTGEKLRSLAEGLAAGNSALKDFFTMEKSFEETNRAEAKVRGQLGLPVGEGRGLLDYGVVAGHEEGRGLVDAQTAYLEVDRRLEQARYGISEDKLGTPEDTRNFVDTTVSQVFNEMLQKNPSQAYLEGAAKLMTQAKLEARVKGDAAWNVVEKKERLNNYSTFVNNHMQGILLPEIQQAVLTGTPVDTKKMRSTFAELTRIGRDQYNTDRTASTVVVIDNLNDYLKTQMTLSLSKEGSFEQVRILEETSEALLESLDLPDAAGIKISNLKEPEILAAMDSVRAVVNGFMGKADAARAQHQALQKDKVLGVAVDMSFKRADPAAIQEFIKKSFNQGDIDGATTLSLVSQMTEANNQGLFSTAPLESVNQWVLNAASGRMTHQQAIALVIGQKLPPKTQATLFQAIGAYQSDLSALRSNAEYARGSASRNTAESARERAETKRSNNSMVRKYFNENNIDATEQPFIIDVLRQTYYDDEIPFDPEAFPSQVENARETGRKLKRLVDEEYRALPVPFTSDPMADKAKVAENKRLAAARANMKVMPVTSSAYRNSEDIILGWNERMKKQRETKIQPVNPQKGTTTPWPTTSSPTSFPEKLPTTPGMR